jgi:hypothetical protein
VAAAHLLHAGGDELHLAVALELLQLLDGLSEAGDLQLEAGPLAQLAKLRAPWGFSVVGRELATFHVVLRGRCVAEVEGMEGVLELAEGGQGKGMASWVRLTMQFLTEESDEGRPGAETVVTRLADILIEAIRSYLESPEASRLGLSVALRDARISGGAGGHPPPPGGGLGRGDAGAEGGDVPHRVRGPLQRAGR